MMTKTRTRRWAIGAVALGATIATMVTLSGCGNGDDSQAKVVTEGSSTVGPLTSVAAELYAEENPDVQVSVGTHGTGGGFEKLCAGEVDIANASRPIKESEIEACKENSVTYGPLVVANDALTVVVNKSNDFVDCLTTEQLKKIWDKDSGVKTWKDVDPAFPAIDMKLYGPGTDSGTFDFFTKAINGEEGRSRTDYTPSEDDNLLVQGVADDAGGLAYFGYTYFEENQDKLKALTIDGGSGCVAPSVQTAQDGSYAPLSRPLFVYVSDKSLKRDEVVEFVEYYIDNIDDIVKEAQFIPLTADQKAELSSEYETLKRKA